MLITKIEYEQILSDGKDMVDANQENEDIDALIYSDSEISVSDK